MSNLPPNLSAAAFADVIGPADDYGVDIAAANVELNEEITTLLCDTRDKLGTILSRHAKWCDKEGLPTEMWSAVDGYDLADLPDALRELTPIVLPGDKRKARAWADRIMQGRV